MPTSEPKRVARRQARTGLILTVALALLSSCVDVRSFEGKWQGGIVDEPAVRQGFTAGVTAELALKNVSLQSMGAGLTTSDDQFKDTTLFRVTKSASDALASITFDGDPLRTYLLFTPPTPGAAGSAVAVVSLFGDDHVELRLIRGNDLFGVFYLRRPNDR